MLLTPLKSCHFLPLFRDAGPKCPVDNERLNESQVIIDDSKPSNTTY